LAFAFTPLLPPTNAQITPLIPLLGGYPTITVAEGEEVTLTKPITGDSKSVLYLEGPGRVNLASDNNSFLGAVIIRGTTLRVSPRGRFYQGHYRVDYGGTLLIDKMGSPKDLIKNEHSSITLFAGKIQYLGYDNVGEALGSLSLEGGANTIEILSSHGSENIRLAANEYFSRHSTATLNLISDRIYIPAMSGSNSVSFYLPIQSQSYFLGKILPWATIGGGNWATYSINRNLLFLIPLTNYHTGAQATWNEAHNISLTRNETLTAHRRINSLRIANPAFTLNLGKNHTLHIKSGGILTTGENMRVTGRGKLTTLDKRPLYIHTYGDKLTLEDEAVLGDETNPKGDIDLVKTGTGSLVLNSKNTHRLGTVTINQGIIKVLKGWLAVAGKIILGDGAGTDVLELGANIKNRIRKTGGGLPSITLYGNPFGPAGDESILRFGGGTQQQLSNLHIQDRGVIDFASGSKSAPNILYLDHLTFNNPDARLTIRNWNYETDYLLIKYKNGNSTIPPILNQIRFEGYDAPALWHWHFLKGFDDYWQITAVPAPEPSTTGALLSLGSLILFIFNKRTHKRASNSSSDRPRKHSYPSSKL